MRVLIGGNGVLLPISFRGVRAVRHGECASRTEDDGVGRAECGTCGLVQTTITNVLGIYLSVSRGQ